MLGAGVCFYQAEDGIGGLCLSRGLGSVYKRQERGQRGGDRADRGREGRWRERGQVEGDRWQIERERADRGRKGR